MGLNERKKKLRGPKHHNGKPRVNLEHLSRSTQEKSERKKKTGHLNNSRSIAPFFYLIGFL